MAWHSQGRKGMASILALILLALFAVLAIACAQTFNASLCQSRNRALVDTARLQAESGLSFLIHHLNRVSLPGGASGEDLLTVLADRLGQRLNGSPNLAGSNVSYDGSVITVPPIATDPTGRGFTIFIRLASASTVAACITGRDGSVTRSIGLDFELGTGRSVVFDYGVASKSAIHLVGNSKIRGANAPAEANILSATYSTDQAFNMTGNAEIAGDISASNADAYASLTGNVKIGGVSASNPAIIDHIHMGIGEVEFPEVDPSVYEPFATNIVDSHTSTNGNKSFTNIRIAAGTNPTFSGNITITGVLFIEAPNSVTFAGNLNFTGVIVTQDAGDNVYDTNTIKFTGNSNFRPVEELPDQPQFTGLKALPGSFLLAPGFGVHFSGNFGTLGGTIAADAFTWVGNANGVVKGTVINYSDSTFSMTGNSNITIDKSAGNDTPPGFVVPGKLTANMESYVEY